MKAYLNLITFFVKLPYVASTIICLVFTIYTGNAQAQLLQLKPGQKFTYEALEYGNTKEPVYSTRSYFYARTNFEVVDFEAGKYTIKVSPALKLSGDADRISDSSAPFAEQEKAFHAIMQKVMTTVSYSIVVDKKGNIIGLKDTAGIKDKVLAKVTELKIPEKYQKNRDAANAVFQESYFRLNADFFKATPKNGTVRRVTKNAEEADSVMIKKLTTRDVNTGLVISTVYDSVMNKTFVDKTRFERAKEVRKISLVKGTAMPLFAEASRTLKYADYYSPLGKAKRAIADLVEYYHNDKGSQTISDEIMHKLDSLDKQFAPDNYEYLAAKLTILCYTGEGYFELLKKVPYQYLTGDSLIDSKLSDELKDGNYQDLIKAIQILFTKMVEEGGYPMNISNLSDDVHEQLGQKVLHAANAQDVQKILDLIIKAEQLHIPTVNQFFAGLKTYCQVKLTTDKQQLNKLINIRNNTLYDRGGRYRTLIYDELAKKHIPDSILTIYNDYTIEMVRNNIAAIKSGYIPGISKFTIENWLKPRIIIYHKYLADAYYRKSLLEKDKAQSYLQMAADYLPTQQDIADNDFGLKAEYKFLPYKQYTDLYLKAADKGGVTNEATLKTYVDLVIIEPERYSLLKEKYTKAFPNGDFKKFFNDALIEKLPAVPAFALNERAGKPVAATDLRGKFTFVDFWGTWCGSCVAEIHKIEELKQANPAPDKLLVSTIACYDKKKDVDDFMAKEKYTYQVLMSDGKVEKDFKIQNYPTKLLLLPNGVYLTVSFFNDYKVLLEKYLKWEI